MAARLGLPGHDQLQHFVASPAWDDAPLWRVLAERADRLVGGPGAVLVIGDTALPKKGALSVGVDRQRCGRPGKKAGCQALVSLTPAGREMPVPVGLRLVPPEGWSADPARCAAAGVPESEIVPRGKGEIALAELDRLRAAGARFGLVLADAGHGAGAAFRRRVPPRLGRAGPDLGGGTPRNQEVHGADARLVPPGGRKRRPVPDQEPREAEEVPAGLPWRRVTWRHGTKGPLAARFAATRIRVGDGATWGDNRHPFGAEVWPAGGWRTGGEREHHLGSLPPRTSLRALAAATEARRACERAHRQLKQELGLGHFGGRSWTGPHRHALMARAAFAYLQHLRLAWHRPTGPGGNAAPRSGTAAITEPAGGAPRRHGAPGRRPRRADPMPLLQTALPTASLPELPR